MRDTLKKLQQKVFLQKWNPQSMYRVVLKKVSFGIFRIILVSMEEKNFTIESKDKVLSLTKFSWYLNTVKVQKIRHPNGHISKKS